MADITLVELHFEDIPSLGLGLGSLTSDAAEADESDGTRTDAGTETDGGGAMDIQAGNRPGAGKWIAALLGLALLVAAAAAAR